jgi:hypothetical protein
MRINYAVSVPAPSGHLHDLGAAVRWSGSKVPPPCGGAQPMAPKSFVYGMPLLY